jgi:hypothetical protein
MPIHAPMPRRRLPALLTCLLLSAVLVAAGLPLGGCSDATAPDKDGGNRLDPGSGTFALKDVSVPGPGGESVLLRLEGSDLVSDPATGTVSLSVQVRNLSGQAVRPPLIVWLSALQPADVVPANADLTLPPTNTDPVVAPDDSTAFGFDYTALLAGQPLAAGEASPAKTWIFDDASLGAFSFAARIECGAFAGQAVLGGRLFVDRNGDGMAQPGEPPFFAGGVQVSGPDGVVSWAAPGPDGHWEVPVAQAGMYEALFMTLDMGPRAHVLTTPNPLNVVITTGSDGELQSWLQADFGLDPGDLPPQPDGAIQFTDRRPAELNVAPWTLLGVRPDGPNLFFSVGFSGCQPEHVFSLWMSGGFQESMPPRAHVTLVHETEEACDAAFSDSLRFDLLPLWDHYLDQYGPGPLIMVLHGTDGIVQEVPLFIAPPDSVWPVGTRQAD